ncbi:MAG: SH3 domain-containing protein [Caldilineaceae bacterium]
MDGLQRWVLTVLLAGLVIWALAACGRDRATPTPIPANVVRPVQPTPAYATALSFTVATPGGEVQLLTGTVTPPLLASLTQPVVLPTPLPLSQADLTRLAPPLMALAIVRSGAPLLDQPNGRTLVNLPAGAPLTVTGKAADGRWLAIYTETGTTGWMAINTLTLFGAADLPVVTTADGPGMIATLLAEAMTPIAMPTLAATPIIPLGQ